MAFGITEINLLINQFNLPEPRAILLLPYLPSSNETIVIKVTLNITHSEKKRLPITFDTRKFKS